jgi:hypothetical protein
MVAAMAKGDKDWQPFAVLQQVKDRGRRMRNNMTAARGVNAAQRPSEIHCGVSASGIAVMNRVAQRLASVGVEGHGVPQGRLYATLNKRQGRRCKPVTRGTLDERHRKELGHEAASEDRPTSV